MDSSLQKPANSPLCSKALSLDVRTPSHFCIQSQSPRTSSQGLCWDQGQGPGQQPALPASLVEEPEVVSLCSLGTSLRFAMHWLLSSRAQGSSQKSEVPAASPASLLCFPSLSENWACLNCEAMNYNGKKK